MSFRTIRVAAVVLIFGLVAAACSPSADEFLANSPLANPTLSFAEPVRQVSSPGSRPSLVGGPVAAQHTTSFEFDAALAGQAFEEIRVQAEAAGYQLELVSLEQRLPSGNWTGTGTGLPILTIRIVNSGGEGTMQVILQ